MLIDQKCPEGYPRLAAFLDSDENFMLYRRFGFLQARLLLHKQDELRLLEQSLDGIDKYDASHQPMILKEREKDDKRIGHRKKLLEEIEQKFGEYGMPSQCIIHVGRYLRALHYLENLISKKIIDDN